MYLEKNLIHVLSINKVSFQPVYIDGKLRCIDLLKDIQISRDDNVMHKEYSGITIKSRPREYVVCMHGKDLNVGNLDSLGIFLQKLGFLEEYKPYKPTKPKKLKKSVKSKLKIKPTEKSSNNDDGFEQLHFLNF